MQKEFLETIDQMVYDFLEKHVDIMPMRFVKLIAYNYTDARVRKLYMTRLGVIMGENTYGNLGMKIVSNDFENKLFIGNNVSIAPNVTFVCESSANNGIEINKIPYVKEKLTKNGEINIDDEVWIGANVTILQGVKIGKCSVVGAGSLVTKNVPDYVVVAGVPAKIIRKLNPNEKY